ncbi:hypothetical protein [Alkalilimnicola sp. S0819]|uniref:hypothetical protein n=1 Tax=Alkalilimnicola sp. S0819 TaxID=2613922 RepID=UPI001261A262|nr:hypothetical protein [Alkalilimnicola sp. S0819]KAB7628178.1 hypothetical protein F3N43_00240 [Alkalilimnicola sp. S0819]MPQ15065.1 hypothetical protein [Alkalilimnicola sp. S0819]
MFQGMNAMAVIATLLGELVLLLVLALVVTGRLWWKARGQVMALNEQLGQGRRGAGDYLAQIRAAMRQTVQSYQSRFQAGPEVLHTAALLRAPNAPDQLVAQLRYEFLRREQRLLENPAAQRDLWRLRGEATTELLECFVTGEEAIRQWWAMQQRRQGDALEHARREGGETEQTLRRKLQRRDLSLEQLKQRVAELDAYKLRFNTLHEQVLQERKANEVLRNRLREQGGQPVAAPLQAYEEQRGALDQYLDRADIAPFALRHVADPNGLSDAHRTQRQRQVLEGAGVRLSTRQGLLRRSLSRQRELIRQLRERVGQAEEREERLKTYYQQKVRHLERVAETAKRNADGLEKEVARTRRASSQLLARLEQQEQEHSAPTVLEQTIDRFAAQAIDMQGRIQALESELDALAAENLNLKARLEAAPAGLSPPADDTDTGGQA